MFEMDASSRTTVLVHYYRAMVGRADVWRTRMDTTTNWAIVSMAAVLSFTLGSERVPHYVVLIAPLMTSLFLMLEARRLTFYHLWQQRVLLLEEAFVRDAVLATGEAAAGSLPAKTKELEPDARAGSVDLARALEPHLGRTAPTMPLSKAVARRLRRVYLYLFAVQLLAWLLKLANPAPGAEREGLAARADVGLVSGEIVLAVAGTSMLVAVLVAFSLGGSGREPA